MGKKKKRSRADWTPPPKSAEQVAFETDLRIRRLRLGQPTVPKRRVILGVFAVALMAGGMFLGFLLPSESLVSDLRSRGVSVWAEVTASPRNKYGSPGNIKVKFDGPEGEMETSLYDWGGMRPEGLFQKAVVSVTYDPRDPTRVLTTAWVKDPPMMTMPMLVALLAFLFFMAGTIFITIRRRVLLKKREQIAAR
ncbi:DUF3592 domain-containing protein [Streptomyces sp. NWU339]|uniref:DUF3592 domain-containing protein n=1 Tax=Streptomyces sp. NWU339 TaxID=2185284 RepID=UPI00215A58BA|nr:DUF3592 domain-containing protein [Streptomyces sp. NWU339]